MSLGDRLRTLQIAWPLLKRALFNGQLFRPRAELTEPHPDILAEYDVKVPIADGIVLTANVFRSRKAEAEGVRVPVVMCAHPYDNRIIPALGRTPFRGPPPHYRIVPQEGRPKFSSITSWESPDPNFWVPAGYAVVNLNLPGFGSSAGPPTVVTDQQAKSYYEAIEWVARQSWCTGKIGLSGVSYLAISQYHVAACRHYGGPPPALKCISPWEGVSDVYRDVACAGGLEDQGFAYFWWMIDMAPSLNGTVEDFVKHNGSLPTEFVKRHPFYDEFWREKAAKLDEITIPMLVCASFSDHGLHTVGSFRAYLKAKTPHKWVYTHRGGKWDVYYAPEVQQLTKEFMDSFLKNDTSNGFLERAPVRLEVRASRDVIHAVRDEQSWPLARTQYTKLFLAPDTRTLDPQNAPATRSVEYRARRGRASFAVRFERDTELTGYMKLRLWVEARAAPDDSGPPPADMAIFVAVNKLDASGRIVHFRGSVGSIVDGVTRGYCRVSRRELDLEESTEYLPVLKGTGNLPLAPNQIVAVDIELYPSSTFFAAGESLELIVSSSEIIRSPPYKKDASFNRGIHVLHCGGEHDSHLLVPVIPPAAPADRHAASGARPPAP